MQHRTIRIVERRAFGARLSACVVPLFAMSVFASVASAAPDVPQLVTTSPPSSASAPAASLTPTIIGEAEPEDGVIEVVPFTVDPLSAPTPRTVEHGTEHPEFEIEIFEGAHCKGAEVASGTAETFEEAGIQVTVGADSETTFSARQVDPEHPTEPSGCSTSLTYWQGTVTSSPGSGSGGSGGSGGSETGGGQAPGGTTTGAGGAVAPATPAGAKPRAPQIHTNPSGVARSLTPLVVGSAPGADTVAVYAGANCGGAPIAKGTAAELASGFQVSVAANSETTFSAVAIGAQHSACSEPVTYTEDSTAPRTRVTMGPGVKTRKRTAIFRFKDVTADPPGTAFACKVDKEKWKHCASPFHLKHLKLGHHLLEIRATDLAGNVEPHPVKRSFRVIRKS